MNAALKIKEIRAALNFSQKQLADLLEIKQTSLSMIELGNNNCTLENAVKLFNKLNVNPIWFFQDKGKMFISEQEGRESHAQLMERGFRSLADYPLQNGQNGRVSKPFSIDYDNQAEVQGRLVQSSADTANTLDALLILEAYIGQQKEQFREKLSYTDAALLVIFQHVNHKHPLENIGIDCHLYENNNLIFHLKANTP